jgi:hypothetical protein
MKPISFLCAVAVSLLLSQSSRAEESIPFPYIVTSPYSQCFFKMIPADINREAFGAAYSLDENGNFKELWKTSGWYSYEVYLSYDGQYLVRMGQTSHSHEPKKQDLAVAFYKNGKLLKEYSVIDLVKDKSKIQPMDVYYAWLARSDIRNILAAAEMNNIEDPENKLRLDNQNIFHLKTIDEIIYQFDATTGEIKKTERTVHNNTPVVVEARIVDFPGCEEYFLYYYINIIKVISNPINAKLDSRIKVRRWFFESKPALNKVYVFDLCYFKEAHPEYGFIVTSFKEK